MAGSFTAAAVTAKTYSPHLHFVSIHNCVLSENLRQPTLIAFLTIVFICHGGWNLGVWVLCIFCFWMCYNLGGRQGQTDPLRGGRTARAAVGRAGCKQCCLAARHLELLLVGGEKKKSNLFFLKKAFWSFLAKWD